MRRNVSFVLAALAVVMLTGCAGLGQLWPGGAKPTDFRVKGVTTAEPEPITVTVGDEEITTGCVILLAEKGITEERTLLLGESLMQWCDLPIFTQLVVDGVPNAKGVIRPSAINPEGVGR